MRIRTTLLASVGALALVAAVAVPAGAGGPTVNPTNDTLTCNSIVGGMTFSPPLVGTATTGSTSIKWKATLSGCVDNTNQYDADTNPGGVDILSGSVGGTLAGGSNDCTALTGLSNAAGTLTIKWKSLSGTPKLTVSSTALSTTNMNGGISAATGAWGGNYGEFKVGTANGTATPSATGAFTGGNSGHTTTMDALTGQDINSLATSCIAAGAGGIKTASFGVGTITLG